MLKLNDQSNQTIRFICPSDTELSVIVNKVQCEHCNLVFSNEPQFKFHDLKVHKRKNLLKKSLENVRYKCPVANCIYALNGKKSFTLYKYLKQHYLKVHAEKIFSCGTCTKSFSTNAAKEAHRRICGIDFVCQCKKTFNSYEALLTHAKRNLHKVDSKYQSKRKNSKKTIGKTHPILPNSVQFATVHILLKPTCNVGVQTEILETEINVKNFRKKNCNNKICQQTQTNDVYKEKQVKKSAETQTIKTNSQTAKINKTRKYKISTSKQSLVKNKDTILIGKAVAADNVLSHSPLSLKHDEILDLWEEKSSLGTQTSPEKNIFGEFDDYNLQHIAYHRISRSDPMLTEETFADKFSSIETQTEKAYYRSIFETDQLSSNNETQTTENFTETMEPLHIYNNTCTQTCDDILSSDLGLSDIQTQTAWHLDESTVSTETQTKAIKCLSGCSESNSWFITQTNHMETQTDLFHIFDELEEKKVPVVYFDE